jgi:hypothetical protein
MAAADIKVFYHVCATGAAWETIVRDQMVKLHFSGLYDACGGVHCWISGEHASAARGVVLEHGRKVAVHACEPADASYERLTLLGMRRHVGPDDKLLYLHSKGVTKNNSTPVLHWRQYMEWHLVKHWRRCVDLLETVDAVGANHSAWPSSHYSGNFWWCTGRHFLRLPPSIGDAYLDPEMYVLSVPSQAVSLPCTEVDHYYYEYPLARYCDDERPAMVVKV